MGLSAYRDGLESILNSAEWIDLLTASQPSLAGDLQRQALLDIAANPTWNGLTSPVVKGLIVQYMRANHALQAENILQQQFTLTSGEAFYLLPDAELRLRYGRIIGQLGRSHWVDVDKLSGMFATTLGVPGDFPPEWTVDGLKLACILRLADAAQIDARRASPLHTPHRQPQGESLDHWRFQERMFSPQIKSGRLVYTSSVSYDLSLADSWWLAFDTVKMIDLELKRVDALCGDLSRPQFRARSVAGADSPVRFSNFVPTEGWTPVDASPHISDVDAVISRLGGRALYGGANANRVPLRELVANAVDATRIRKAATGREDVPGVVVSVRSEAEADYISVRDHGIGMSADDMVRYLCNFGSSGWRGSAVRDVLPGAVGRGVTPTGRYGIGFFASFMVADHVTVVSRPLQGGWDDTVVLEFRSGASVRPILRAASKMEQLEEPGTRVSLKLNRRLGVENGMFSDLPSAWLSNPEAIARELRPDYLMLDVSVDLCVGNLKCSLAVADAWKTAPADVIFDAFNWYIALYSPAESDAMRQAFARLLKPVFSPDEEIVGRLALRGGALAGGWIEASPAAIYCGGFEADTIYELSGMLAAEPDRAARDRARSELPLESFHRWLTSVADAADGTALLAGNEGLLAQAVACQLGVELDGVPFAVGARGALSRRELAELLDGRDDIVVYSMPAQYVQINESTPGFLLVAGSDMAVLRDGQIVVPTGMSSPHQPLPRRPNELAHAWPDRVPTESGFDPVAWWRREFHEPIAEVARIASSVWEVDLQRLVEGVLYVPGYGSAPTFATLDTASGRGGRATAYVYSRPKSE